MGKALAAIDISSSPNGVQQPAYPHGANTEATSKREGNHAKNI